MFSWELGGSSTSLLGTGVWLAWRPTLERELDRPVDSCRQGDCDAAVLTWRAVSGPGVAVLTELADFVKKLMMERWLLPDGVLAGVRTGVERFSTIVQVFEGQLRLTRYR